MVSRVKSAIRHDETTLRLGGDGYISAMTWTADNRQLVTERWVPSVEWRRVSCS